ncbi:hypothetical protein JOM56_008018 [Amanita muscaria]
MSPLPSPVSSLLHCMANTTKLKPHPAPSISQRAPTSPVILLKRKEPPGSTENEQTRFSPSSVLPTGTTDTQRGEYEKCCITCEVCGTGTGFRDEETSGFASKHWEACSMPGQSSTDPVIYTSESTADALAHPLTNRRREKRTEEKRIDYLRADPYVAQFEAYRVLCVSCDKWIRLRPNSTYCSTPWDAHIKSCLAKKVKNVYAVEERNTLILPEPISAPPLTDLMALISPGLSFCGVQIPLPHSVTRHAVSPKPVPIFAHSNSAQLRNHASDNPSFHDYNPSNYAPTHESRRRTLRADSLISEVEPNRVFCSLCQKWVQPRQDSPYCAYPWLRHCGECLARQYVSLSPFIPPC